jgi:lipopolysaccharide biosynthesis glycosyltransferase
MTAQQPLRIFIGVDPRQPIAYNVLQHSIIGNTSRAVSINPLVLRTLPIKRTGLTEFTYSRFLVPWLCNYQGFALFLDADMVVDGDIAELFAIATHEPHVFVNRTLPPFEWPSAMLFNNARCTALTPEFIETGNPFKLDTWASTLGDMPTEWNYCVPYSFNTPISSKPKLLHYTGGIPIWPETHDSKHADIWRKYHAGMNASVEYNALMANSVHDKFVKAGAHRG